MPIWQLCANLLIPNCLRSNLSYSPLAALELYVNKNNKVFTYSKIGIKNKKPVINSIYNEQIKLMTGRKEYYNVYRLRLEIQLKIMVQT